MHEDTEAKKLMGGNGFGQSGTKLDKKLFFLVQGTLQGLETSAVRSQSFNLERELPEFLNIRGTTGISNVQNNVGHQGNP